MNLTGKMTHSTASNNKNVQNGAVERKPHPDIDGGWGWMVVFASFAIHIVSKYHCSLFIV